MKAISKIISTVTITCHIPEIDPQHFTLTDIDFLITGMFATDTSPTLKHIHLPTFIVHYEDGTTEEMNSKQLRKMLEERI